MTTIPRHPTRQAELERFATDHGQTIAEALDDAIALYLDIQNHSFEADLVAVKETIGDLHDGRSVSLEEFDAVMRRRYEIAR